MGILFIFFLLFSSVGCKKKATEEEQSIAEAQSVSQPQFNEEESSSTPSEPTSIEISEPTEETSSSSDSSVETPSETSNQTPSQSTSKAVAEQKTPQERIDDMFIYKYNGRRVVPEDYLIGPLENEQSNDYRVTQVLKTVNGFFRDLRREEINEEWIHPTARLLLVAAFQFYLDEEAIPDVVRIGKVEFSGKTAKINLRFYREEGITDGEAILEEVGDGKESKWLLTDIQVDLMQLLDKYTPSKEPFEPGAYNFYDWE